MIGNSEDKWTIDRYIGYDGHKLTSHKFNLTGVIFSSVYAIFVQQACKTLNKIY